MYCSKCGKEIPDESNFCLFCGHQIKSTNDNVIEEYPSTQNEKKYEKAMKWISDNFMKSPSTATWPKYTDNMVEFSGLFSTIKVIQTYIDAVNSYGAIVRTETRLKLDEHDNIVSFAFKNPNEYTYSMYKSIYI